MEDSFVIDVAFAGKDYNVEVRLISTGYIHRFITIINDIEVIYEPDEERNYRATVNEAAISKLRDADKELIKAVAERLRDLSQ